MYYIYFFFKITRSQLMTRRFFSLFRDRNFIGGKWVEAQSPKTFVVTNPANDKVIGSVQDSTSADAEQAIAQASASFKSWAATPAKERGRLLRNLCELVNQHSDELARIMTAECGKPLTEAKNEVIYSAGKEHNN